MVDKVVPAGLVSVTEIGVVPAADDPHCVACAASVYKSNPSELVPCVIVRGEGAGRLRQTSALGVKVTGGQVHVTVTEPVDVTVVEAIGL